MPWNVKKQPTYCVLYCRSQILSSAMNLWNTTPEGLEGGPSLDAHSCIQFFHCVTWLAHDQSMCHLNSNLDRPICLSTVSLPMTEWLWSDDSDLTGLHKHPQNAHLFRIRTFRKQYHWSLLSMPFLWGYLVICVCDTTNLPYGVQYEIARLITMNHLCYNQIFIEDLDKLWGLNAMAAPNTADWSSSLWPVSVRLSSALVSIPSRGTHFKNRLSCLPFIVPANKYAV